jgi:hypothetical protein
MSRPHRFARLSMSTSALSALLLGGCGLSHENEQADLGATRRARALESLVTLRAAIG